MCPLPEDPPAIARLGAVMRGGRLERWQDLIKASVVVLSVLTSILSVSRNVQAPPHFSHEELRPYEVMSPIIHGVTPILRGIILCRGRPPAVPCDQAGYRSSQVAASALATDISRR